MNLLDDIDQIKKLDKSGVYQSIESLDEQCSDAWQKVQQVAVPSSYQNFSNIVVSGMGGSALGAHVIQSLYRDQLKAPLVIVRDYHLPEFVNQNSLVVLSSYSGTTEETVSCAQEAIAKKCKSFIITSGGQLQEFSQKYSLPIYLINPVFNPCGQPRMAIGYSIFSQLSLFAKLGLIQLNEEEVKKTIQFIKQLQMKFSLDVSSVQNEAKRLALAIEEKIPILVTAEHLVGATHVFNNQLNENAKHLSDFREIPELNHHLMEGLSQPETNKKHLIFVFLNSSHYSLRIKQRFELTGDVVLKNKIAAFNYQLPEALDKLTDAFSLITFGAFASFYLAMTHRLDPTPIPWVDYFKDSLKKIDRQK